MPRGKRRPIEDRIQELQLQIDAVDAKRNTLAAEMEELLNAKRNEEVGELYELLQQTGLTVEDMKQMVYSQEQSA